MIAGSFTVASFTFRASHPRETARCTRNRDDRLIIAAKRYTPLNNANPQKNDVSIIVAHANGFHKELYEPFIDELLMKSERLGFKIRNFWIMDAAHQGESGILNEDKLGDDYEWNDSARDIEVMISNFDIPQPLIGIGHSMGGCQLFLASIRHPRLFVALVGIDPVIDSSGHLRSWNPAVLSARRKDIWSSKEEAAKYLSTRPFYQRWDPRVLKLHLEYGLRNLPTATYPDKTGVTLATTKHQEVWTFQKLRPDGTFARFEPRYVAEQLPLIQWPVLYIMGGKSEVCPPETNHLKKDNTPGCELVVMENAGHLIPQEHPAECADIIGGFIAKCLEKYVKECEEDEKTPRERQLSRRVLEALNPQNKL